MFQINDEKQRIIMLITFKVPFRILVVGCSGSGKSTLVAELIRRRDEFFDTPFQKIFYCAKYSTSVPEIIKDDPILKFHEGIPSDEIIENSDQTHILLVLDDLLESAFSSDTVSSIFTQGRNRKLSIFLLSQNLFPPYAKARNISLNASHIIVFRNLRDSSSIGHLARQVFNSHSKSFCDLFINNVSQPFAHLLFDFSTENNANFLRYRENILNKYPIIYSNDETISESCERYKTSKEVQGFIVEL